MKKKNAVNKLPDWFDINKYEKTKQFTAKDWSIALSFRLYMMECLSNIQKEGDKHCQLKFKKALLFCFKEIAQNPIDIYVTSKKMKQGFRRKALDYRKASENLGSTLFLLTQNLNPNEVKSDIASFLIEHEISLTVQLREPIDPLTPYALKTLNTIYKERKSEQFNRIYDELSKSDPELNLDLLQETLDDQSVSSFIRAELEFRDPEDKLKRKLQLAEIKSTDEIIVVDLLHDEDVLVSQFKETIRKLKSNMNTPVKKLKASENKLAKLSTYKVLPYIDLVMWGDYIEEKISTDTMDAVLFPLETHTTDISKKFSQEVLSIQFIKSLIAI